MDVFGMPIHANMENYPRAGWITGNPKLPQIKHVTIGKPTDYEEAAGLLWLSGSANLKERMPWKCGLGDS